MATLHLDDAREYIFPLLSVRAGADKNDVYMENYVYLGTAFFITKKGDAIASGHTVPSQEELPAGRRLVAIVLVEGKQQVCWVNYAARFEVLDFALVKINLQQTKFLDVSFDIVHNGTDLSLIGIPEHSISGTGKEMRVLKGHVTFSFSDHLELSTPIPSGMSGSPVFAGTKVVAYATGDVKSETLEEIIEEEITEKDTGERIRKITEVRSVTRYGEVRPLSVLKDMRHQVLEHRSLGEFIAMQNRES